MVQFALYYHFTMVATNNSYNVHLFLVTLATVATHVHFHLFCECFYYRGCTLLCYSLCIGDREQQDSIPMAGATNKHCSFLALYE